YLHRRVRCHFRPQELAGHAVERRKPHDPARPTVHLASRSSKRRAILKLSKQRYQDWKASFLNCRTRWLVRKSRVTLRNWSRSTMNISRQKPAWPSCTTNGSELKQLRIRQDIKTAH